MHLTTRSALYALLALVVSSTNAQQTTKKTMPIGSSSMEPTFRKADQIIINLDAYASADPKRGDVVTYRSPENGLYWTHRIIGIPGDRVSYSKDKRIAVNGELAKLAPADVPGARQVDPTYSRYRETVSGQSYLIQHQPNRPSFSPSAVKPFVHKDLCVYTQEDFACTVPEDHYFVMGDNRDASFDSRYFGFIARDAVGGRVEGADRLPQRK